MAVGVGLQLLLRGLMVHLPGGTLRLQSPLSQIPSHPSHGLSLVTEFPLLSLHVCPPDPLIQATSSPLDPLQGMGFHTRESCPSMIEQRGWVLILCLVPSGVGVHNSLESLDSSSHSPAPSRALLNWRMADCSICCGLWLWFLDGPADPQGPLTVCCSRLCPAGL